MARKEAPLNDVLAVRYAFKKLGAECSQEEFENGLEPENVTIDQIVDVVKQEFTDIGKFGKRRAMNAVYQIMCDTNEAFSKNDKYIIIRNPYLDINQ